MIEFRSIPVGSKVWYWVESTDKLEEATVRAIYCTANDPEGINSYVDTKDCFLYVKGYGKEWFTSFEDATAEMARVHDHLIKFGDTVEFLPTHEQGVVYSVSYKQDKDWYIAPSFSVAFENHYRNGVRENELKLIGNAFSDFQRAVKEGIEDGKKEVKDVITHLLSDTPKFARKKSIPKSAIMDVLEVACKN